MSTLVGFKTPSAGQKELGKRHTVWVQFKKGGPWYSPKLVSGASADLNTHVHLRLLQKKHPSMKVMRKAA